MCCIVHIYRGSTHEKSKESIQVSIFLLYLVRKLIHVTPCNNFLNKIPSKELWVFVSLLIKTKYKNYRRRTLSFIFSWKWWLVIKKELKYCLPSTAIHLLSLVIQKRKFVTTRVTVYPLYFNWWFFPLYLSIFSQAKEWSF